MRSRLRRTALLVLVLLTGSITAPSSAAALTWGTRIAITTNRNAVVSTHALVTPSSTAAYLVDANAAGGILRVWFQKSSNSGVTWTTPVQLSSAAAGVATAPTISARGAVIEAAWIEQTVDGYTYSVKYRRSTNYGGTWAAPITLVSSAPILSVRLTRDSSNRVFVVWTDSQAGSIRMRRSLDGGTTWKTAVTLGTSYNRPSGSLRDGFPVVASGTSVVYMAYQVSAAKLSIRRSLDGGATWAAAVTLSTVAGGFDPDIAASGYLVVVGYTTYVSGHLYTTYRRSTDRGLHWLTAKALAPTTGAWSYEPRLMASGATVRLVYERDGDVAGTTSGVWYRQSTDSGNTWAAAVKISNTTRRYSTPGGIGFTNAVVVTWFDWEPAMLDSDVYVRRGA